MNGNGRAAAQVGGGFGHCLDVFDAMHRRREVIAQSVLFLTAKDADHYQDPAANSGIAQGYSLVGGGDAKPAGALLLESKSTRFGAVPVGVALDHGADLDVCAEVAAQRTEVVAQGGERDFSPVGPGGRTDRCRRERQGKMIARFEDEGGGEALPVLATGC